MFCLHVKYRREPTHTSSQQRAKVKCALKQHFNSNDIHIGLESHALLFLSFFSSFNCKFRRIWRFQRASPIDATMYYDVSAEQQLLISLDCMENYNWNFVISGQKRAQHKQEEEGGEGKTYAEICNDQLCTRNGKYQLSRRDAGIVFYGNIYWFSVVRVCTPIKYK